MIPISLDAQSAIGNYSNGNFGLWFNKFVEIENNFKPKDNAVKDYLEKYKSIKNSADDLIKLKHIYQYAFTQSFNDKYELLVIQATLKTPLITGIGQAHPNEVGMTFDHNTGVPYIPASSIKGIVRFAHTLDLVKNLDTNNIKIYEDKHGKEYFDDEADWTNIPCLFGKGGDKGNVGRVIFLDAYSEKVPELHMDIMNPHYSNYYSGNEAPSDDLDPKPLKFLSVAKGTSFIFRILIEKKYSYLQDGKTITSLIKRAFSDVLSVEGIGAKTAVGYGHFEDFIYSEPDWLITLYEEKYISQEEKLEMQEKRFLERISKADFASEIINSLFTEWQSQEELNNNTLIAKEFETKIKKKKANKEFTAQYIKVAKILDIDLTNKKEEVIAVDKSEDIEEKELKTARNSLKKAKNDSKKIKKVFKKIPKKYHVKLRDEFGIDEGLL